MPVQVLHVVLPSRTGGSQWPGRGHARCSPNSDWRWCVRQQRGCSRSRANASVVRSSSSGLRLISRTWLNAPGSGWPVPSWPR